MKNKTEEIRAMVRQIQRTFNKFSRIESTRPQINEKISVTMKEIHTIQAIGDHEHFNVTELASFCGVTKSAASQLISKLVKNNLVRKKPSAHSNKEVELSLTDSGWQVYRFHDRLQNKYTSDLIDRLNAFSVSQITSTSVLLEVFESILDKALIDYSARP